MCRVGRAAIHLVEAQTSQVRLLGPAPVKFCGVERNWNDEPDSKCFSGGREYTVDSKSILERDGGSNPP